MEAFSSNAILAKARSMYAKSMTKENYDELLKRRSVGEVVSYLKNETEYRFVLENVKESNIHRGELEQLLSKEFYSRISKLIRYASNDKKEFYHMGIMLGEIKLILNRVRTFDSKIYTGYDLNIPVYLAKQASFDVYELMNTSCYNDVLELLENTKYYEIFKMCKPGINQKIDFNVLEKNLNKFYFDTYVHVIKKLYKGKKQRELLKVLYTNIELQNITKIYRLKKYFKASPDYIKTMLLLDYSRIPKHVMDELLSTPDADAFLKQLSNLSYHIYVDDKEYVFIEYFANQIKYHLAKHYMRFSTDASLVFMTYEILLELEIENLKHIIEGVRYNELSPNIEKMLIY